MTTLVITDKQDIREIVNDTKRYTYEGDGVYRSPIGTRFQVPLEYVPHTDEPVETVVDETQIVSDTPKQEPTVCVREHIIMMDGERYVRLPGGDIPYDDWRAMTHTVRDDDKPKHVRRPHYEESMTPSVYSLGESNRGKPVIKKGRRTIEWGFKSIHEAQLRLDLLREAERMFG